MLISITRFNAVEASKITKKQGIFVNVVHLYQIKPLNFSKSSLESLKRSKFGGIVLDDYVDGVSKNIALDLNHLTKKVNVMGLEDKSAGFTLKLIIYL